VIPLAEVAAFQEADRAAVAAGTPVAVLMGRAGWALARTGRGLLGGVAGRRVVAVAGKGHNGGDALEALTRLARAGAGAEALLTAEPEQLDDEGRRCVAAVRAAGGRVRVFERELAGRVLSAADLVLDGLLGTGSTGAPRGVVAEAIDSVNASPARVLAVDIPSGVDGATGAVPAQAVQADATVTFQAAKPGHVLAPGSGLVGRLEVVDIGLPLAPGPLGITEAADLTGLVPLPQAEQHKRSRGVLLAVGGSSDLGGAPTLVGLAAHRSGAGLLVLAVPASVAQRVGAAVPEALTVHLPEADGGITPDAVAACRRWLEEATALAIGPGLGRSAATVEAVKALLARFERPAVVDADGLFALGTGAALAERQAPTLVTPHAGEFARMAPDAKGTRLHQAADRARRWRATVLLKGNHTVVAEPGGRLAVNPTGTPVLATGGTGDVLTGLAGVLLAHGLDPFDTGRLGAWVHGRAGALAARALSPVSVAAADVAEHLPAAFAELLAASPRARSTDMPPARGPW
jgi:hydroxyethylthiazole kinase-like uncharacterized protein yjeF